MRNRHNQSPETIYIKREFYSTGCGGCKNSIQDKATFRWKCSKEVENYPNKSEKDCFFFVKKKG